MTATPTSTEPDVLRPIQSLNIREHKVADLVDLLVPWFAHLAESGTIATSEIPSDDEVADWTRSLFTDQGGRLRVRRSPAKGATNVHRSVAGLYRWHRSGGHLDGLFIARMNGGEAFPRVETYLAVLQVASGHESAALAAWKRTGLI